MANEYQEGTKTIWAYWETLPGRTKPVHIELAHRALQKNRGDDLALHILAPEDLPKLDIEFHPAWRKLAEPAHRADYLRVALLHRYGGFWVDSDIITIRPFSSAAKLLDDYDFVAWEYRSGTNGKETTFRVPISCFGVRPKARVMKLWLDEIHKVFDSGEELGKDTWHSLGREIFNPLLEEEVSAGRMSYYAMHAEALTIPIKAKQRAKFFEIEALRGYIKDDPLQPHINYFNSWMPKIQKMSESRILGGDEIICQMFQYALQPERRAELLSFTTEMLEEAPPSRVAKAAPSTPAHDNESTTMSTSPATSSKSSLSPAQRKLRKLVRNPGLFIKDFAKNRTGSNGGSQQALPGPSASNKEVVALLEEIRDEQQSLTKSLRATRRSVEANAVFGVRSWLYPQRSKALHGALYETADSLKGNYDGSKLQRFVSRYMEHLDTMDADVFSRLEDDDRAVFMRWLMKRFAKVDILEEGELEAYEHMVAKIKKIPLDKELTFRGRKFKVKNLESIGYDLPFVRTSDLVLMNDFYLDQYHHKDVYVREGDVVIDAGAYTGDTAVVFGHNTDWKTEIHCFELSQANIDCFEANIELNPQLKGKVSINRLALTEASGDTVYFNEGKHEDSVYSAFKIGADDTGVAVPTISIDEYMEDKGLERMDFIKMDIEGAERGALAGAKKTISTYKPRLAISFYHLWDDPFVLPRLIHEMHDDYVFYFNWYNKRMANEAVLYAIDRSELERRRAEA